MDQKIDKSCLQLCIALLDHRLDHDEYESAIVSYLAVAALQHIPGDNPVQYFYLYSSHTVQTLRALDISTCSIARFTRSGTGGYVLDTSVCTVLSLALIPYY